MASQYLEKYHYNVQQAIDAYFEPAQRLRQPDKAVVAIFDTYADPQDRDVILIDGTLAYLDALGFDPEQLVSLTLAYVLKLPQTGEFRRAEFCDTWTELGALSVPAMRQYVLQHHQQLVAGPGFEGLYQYVFDFVRGSDTRIKTIAYDDAVMYWRLLFSERTLLDKCRERLEQWYRFVESNEKNVSKDTWNMFYKFVVQVVEPDPETLAEYDEMSAWPSMVDEYMEYLDEQA